MAAKGAEQFLSPQSLTDRITVTLREHIVGGKYAPGRQLPAGKDLSQAFGVSITVIREALSRLKADGLVASRQGKGVFVSNDSNCGWASRFRRQVWRRNAGRRATSPS